MNDLIISTSSESLLPVTPRVPMRVRPAVLSDVPFMDSLQKMHSKMVGFMPTNQFEQNIAAGRVLVAEEVASCELPVAGKDAQGGEGFSPSSLATGNQQPATPAQPVGYCLASDRYFKHDDVGIIYQMNVLPGRQRSLVGAMLLKAKFERSAYGCKLYCCWCAQDLAANRFWEAMGFVPLAFRTGSERRGSKGGARIHIFWQKRIRSGDTTTPWWFPSETSGGAVRSNRIVLPIPPGTHWSDAKPVVLPGMERERDQLALSKPRTPRVKKPKVETPKPTVSSMGGLRFGPAAPAPGEVQKDKKQPKPRVKNDPQLVKAARELRDRWLEQVNAMPLIGCAKYDVNRVLPHQEQSPVAVQIARAAPVLTAPLAA